MKKLVKIILLFLATILVFPYGSPARANSGPSMWEGVSSTGVIITDEKCPIEVEGEELTFDIKEFPKKYYDTQEEYLKYDGKVTAKYSFYNPADYTVNATLIFPFGNSPQYYHVYNTSEQGLDTDKYDITINGVAIEKKLRHTFTNNYEEFNLQKDMAKLYDGYIPDDFYSPDMPVTQYIYTISGIEKDKYPQAYASVSLLADSNKTKAFLEDCSGGSFGDNGVQAGRWVASGDTFSIYVIGEPLDKMPRWTVYENGEEKNEVQGDISLSKVEAMTFEDLALTDYNDNSTVSKYDWYNAVVMVLKENGFEYGFFTVDNYMDVSNYLMRWYQYEITIGPGERITNEVTAPIYPSIYTNYKPDIYGYTYLLSPAKAWSSFGTLKVNISTPYYITESSIDGFTRTEDGYSMLLDGLPEGELEFTLSSSKKPREAILGSSYMEGIISYFLMKVLGVLIIIGGIIVVLILLVRKRVRDK